MACEFRCVVSGLKKHYGSGGIRTHASEETGALNQRLRPLGHATLDIFQIWALLERIVPLTAHFLAQLHSWLAGTMQKNKIGPLAELHLASVAQ